MPFSFRRVFHHKSSNTEKKKIVEGSPGSDEFASSKNRDAEGLVEAKYVRNTELFSWKEMWKLQYCVIKNGYLCLFSNETCEETGVSINIAPSIREYSAYYRMRRRWDTPENPWPKLECVFTFVTKLDDKLKLRVFGEDEGHYWMTKFGKLFGKTFCRTCSPFRRTLGPTSTVMTTGTWMMDPSSASTSITSDQQRIQKTTPITKRQARATTMPSLFGDQQQRPNNLGHLDQSITVVDDQQELRHRMANEFVDTVRRTDSMLEGREHALRCRLDEMRRNIGGDMTMLSTNAGGPITEHDEDDASQLTTTTAVTLDQSPCVRPSAIVKSSMGSQSGSATMIKSRTVVEDGSIAAAGGGATTIGLSPLALPTIVDDPFDTSSTTSAEVRFKSSAYLKFGGDHRPPMMVEFGKGTKKESSKIADQLNSSINVSQLDRSILRSSTPVDHKREMLDELSKIMQDIQSIEIDDDGRVKKSIGNDRSIQASPRMGNGTAARASNQSAMNGARRASSMITDTIVFTSPKSISKLNVTTSTPTTPILPSFSSFPKPSSIPPPPPLPPPLCLEQILLVKSMQQQQRMESKYDENGSIAQKSPSNIKSLLSTSLKAVDPPMPPASSSLLSMNQQSSTSSMKSATLPSSFLAELREAAQKRRMSMSKGEGGGNEEASTKL